MYNTIFDVQELVDNSKPGAFEASTLLNLAVLGHALAGRGGQTTGLWSA